MRQLRPYQQAALDATLDKLRSFDSAVVVLPTGCGKTVYAARLISQWDRGNTLFLAHTRELIEQAADKLKGELGYRPPVEMNVSTVEIDQIYSGDMCVVGSVQTMYSDRRLEKYRRHPFGLILIDECHHASAASYRKIIDFFREINPSLKVVGITATPNRADGTALGTVFQSEAYQMSIADAVNDGWLVPVEQEYIVCEEIHYDDIKTRKNEFGETDFNGAALEDILTEEKALHAIAAPLLAKAGDKPGLVFCAGVRHAHLLAAILNRSKPGCAQAVDGKTDRAARLRIVRDFSEGRVQFLSNCMVFTEGFDVPNCSLVAMARPTKSLSMYMQMLGRGLRPLPGVVDGVPEAFDRRMGIMTSAKPACHVLDFVGNSNHKLANVFDVLGGQYDVPTRELAAAESRRNKKPVDELLEQARLLRQLEMQWREREGIRPDVSFESWAVNPFGDGAAPAVSSSGKGRGGCSDAQIGLLVKLGIPYADAAAYSKKQAGAVIDKLSQTRCTPKQAAALRRAGVNPVGIGLDRAGRILDALAANG
ncbi:DEAD/DEAH box helicase, partial [Zavarzinella formosa]|uniref:DEAD/DEAH box helicase n=1 Tax=Zavarzinella formosa TaxID=360055 RepID=UPI000361C29F